MHSVAEPQLDANNHAGNQWYNSFKIQAIIIAVLSVAFYWNTFKHEYALDDTVVILKNEYVHQGFAGIKDIMTKDAYFSYYEQLKSTNQLSGGRYRPLSIATFAVEQQFFGAVTDPAKDSIINYGIGYEQEAPYEKKFIQEMHVRHVVNVLLYALMGIVLLWFLRSVVFKNSPLPAFIAALLFAVHPIHTEVVANVKSRDEIMSLLFICLTFICAFKTRGQGGKKWLVLGLLSYFLAFLSKEYAITLVVLLPVAFYLLNRETVKKSLLASLPYFAVAAVYLFIRFQIIGPRSELSDDDIQINPYAWASASEKLATEIATSLNYLKLLIFPHPLSSDYSYNQIPYKEFGHPLVWASILAHVALVVGFFWFMKKHPILSFAIAFYVLNLLMVNNFLFDIGATMGERLIFHASVGFMIAIAYLLSIVLQKVGSIQTRQGLAIGGITLIVILCGFKTIHRNKDWKNDETLFMQDINTSPNSFLVNANVATLLINRSDFEQNEQKKNEELKRGIRLFDKVIGMQDNYVLGYMNRSIGYLKLGYADSMVMDLDKIYKLYPIHPRLPEMYYHAGMLYYQQRQYENAKATLTVSEKLYPNDLSLQRALNDVNNVLQAQK
ncbi:MAG: bacteriophage receptor, outer rane subunit [Flavipsychrobacter sp.]|nr:bacteriophage receptor, outer rane subunit [Flavipsychrobacter sp.]